MYLPVPNGEPHLEGAESEGNNDIDYADDSDDDSDDSDDDEEVESPPCTERCTKQSQEPAVVHGKATSLSARTPKCTWTSTPDPTEKATKQAKVIPPKYRNALPRIKVFVPIALA